MPQVTVTNKVIFVLIEITFFKYYAFIVCHIDHIDFFSALSIRLINRKYLLNKPVFIQSESEIDLKHTVSVYFVSYNVIGLFIEIYCILNKGIKEFHRCNTGAHSASGPLISTHWHIYIIITSF